MYKWVAINMGRYHKYITDCIYNQLVVLFSSLNKGFFFEQLLSTKVEFKIKYVLHYYAHERFNIFKPARVQT